MRKKFYWLVALIILLGTVFQCLTVFRSGLWHDFGMGFWGPTGRDLVWHQALVERLIKNVPPQNPGLAGVILTNYHYFYDLLVAVTHQLTGFSVIDLIYRIYPIIFSFLFGFGTYLLAQKLFCNKLATILSLFFAYFAGSFGWIVEWIHFRKLGGESAFWMNQPVSMNLNPPFAVSMVIVIGILLLWDKYFKKSSIGSLIVLGALTFVLFYFKSYAGLIMSFAFLYSCINTLIQKKYLSSFVHICLFIVILGSLFWLNRGASGAFEWQPFWLVNGAITFPDRVGWEKLASAITNYWLGGNYLKFILAEFLALVIFIVGNLGFRIVGFFVIFDKKIINQPLAQLLSFLSVVSLVPALLFVQKGNPWNTIQFSYYFLYFSALFAGSALAGLSKKLPRATYILLLLVVLLLSPISSFTTFTFGTYKLPPAMLTREEYKALEFLKDQPEGVVLTYPYHSGLREKAKTNPYPLSIYTNTDYVVAFSGKSTYLGDVEQQKILQTDYEVRLGFPINNRDITYIYLPKIYGISFGEESGLKKIFDNQEVLIYTKNK